MGLYKLSIDILFITYDYYFRRYTRSKCDMFSLHPCSRCYPIPSAGKDVVLRQYESPHIHGTFILDTVSTVHSNLLFQVRLYPWEFSKQNHARGIPEVNSLAPGLVHQLWRRLHLLTKSALSRNVTLNAYSSRIHGSAWLKEKRTYVFLTNLAFRGKNTEKKFSGQQRRVFHCFILSNWGARGSVVGRGTKLQAGRSRVRCHWIFQMT
jgi:hypothetical protein